MADKLCQLWKQIGCMVKLHEFSFYITFFLIFDTFIQTKLFSLKSPDDLELGVLSRLTEAISSYFHTKFMIFLQDIEGHGE